MKSSWRSPDGGSFGSMRYRSIALWGRSLRLVRYRFDTYPEFSYSLSRHSGGALPYVLLSLDPGPDNEGRM